MAPTSVVSAPSITGCALTPEPSSPVSTLPTLHPPVLTRPVHARLAGLSVELSATMASGDRGQGAVKSKQPAPMQVTAEQILREAHERQEDEAYIAPKQKITDPEELAVYRMRERKHFEDRLRMSRNAMGTWLKYGSFEEAQRDFERARSVYERALDVDHRNTTLWLKYSRTFNPHLLPTPLPVLTQSLNPSLNPSLDLSLNPRLNPTLEPSLNPSRSPRLSPGTPRWRCATGTSTRRATCGTAPSR